MAENANAHLVGQESAPSTIHVDRSRIRQFAQAVGVTDPACYDEAPVLERNWRGYRDRGVAVIGIDIQDTDEAARKSIDTFSLTFPNARDVGGRVSVDYGVYGVPETFFIDRAGRIRAKHVGAVTDAVFREHVDRLLAEEA